MQTFVAALSRNVLRRYWACPPRFETMKPASLKVRFLFQYTHGNFCKRFVSVSLSQYPFCPICNFRSWVPAKATLDARRRHEEWGCGDREREWLSAGRQSNLRVWRSASLTNYLPPWSQAIRNWHRGLAKHAQKTRKFYPQELSWKYRGTGEECIFSIVKPTSCTFIEFINN